MTGGGLIFNPLIPSDLTRSSIFKWTAAKRTAKHEPWVQGFLTMFYFASAGSDFWLTALTGWRRKLERDEAPGSTTHLIPQTFFGRYNDDSISFQNPNHDLERLVPSIIVNQMIPSPCCRRQFTSPCSSSWKRSASCSGRVTLSISHEQWTILKFTSRQGKAPSDRFHSSLPLSRTHGANHWPGGELGLSFEAPKPPLCNLDVA